MVSICFKCLNKKTIIDLECILENNDLENVIYIKRKFKTYYNLIIHYCGKNINIFYKKLSDLFSIFIINNYEEKIITSQLRLDFFYFSSSEQKEILKNFNNKLLQENIRNTKLIILNKAIYQYIINSKKIYIDGFINFRIFDYRKYLNNLLENEIHEYVVKKEYTQYTDLLKDYINEKINNDSTKTELIHLLYFDTEKIILDEKYNLVTTTSDKKYLSDISFSENDFILNSILSLIPKKLVIHTNYKDDNFITFLESIFENKYVLCDNCDFCKNKNVNKIVIKNN